MHALTKTALNLVKHATVHLAHGKPNSGAGVEIAVSLSKAANLFPYKRIGKF